MQRLAPRSPVVPKSITQFTAPSVLIAPTANHAPVSLHASFRRSSDSPSGLLAFQPHPPILTYSSPSPLTHPKSIQPPTSSTKVPPVTTHPKTALTARFASTRVSPCQQNRPPLLKHSSVAYFAASVLITRQQPHATSPYSGWCDYRPGSRAARLSRSRQLGCVAPQQHLGKPHKSSSPTCLRSAQRRAMLRRSKAAATLPSRQARRRRRRIFAERLDFPARPASLIWTTMVSM